jgi:HSP20 family protein
VRAIVIKEPNMNELQSTATRRPAGPTLNPHVDVLEDASGLTLLVDMPGVPKDAIELKLEGDALSIGGDIVADSVPGLQPVYTELAAARYQRAFTLSRELDASRIEASGRDGVLRLRIPKTERAQPRRIEVRSA